MCCCHAQIDSGGDGVIQKDKFCSYFLQQLREKDSSNVHHLPFQEPPKFRHNMASKETLCRLMFSGPVPRYISISKVSIIYRVSFHLEYHFFLWAISFIQTRKSCTIIIGLMTYNNYYV